MTTENLPGTTNQRRRTSTDQVALAALLMGAAAIGFAPIFVRLSETGPVATAFFRVFLALPVLWLWVRAERPDPAEAAPQAQALVGSQSPAAAVAGTWWGFALAGFFFAGDLAFWHWSLKLTSVANSTLLTNLAPVFVMVGARIFFSERITFLLVAGMALALVGGALLVGNSGQLGEQNLRGDLLAVLTALFYAAYLLMVKYLRRSASTARILAFSGLVSCPLLFLAGWFSGDSFEILSSKGWWILIGLALVSHVGGQGLITYALAHLRASFSALSLLLQPVVAAVLAWQLLAEPLTPLQMVGGIVLMIGVALARQPDV